MQSALSKVAVAAPHHVLTAPHCLPPPRVSFLLRIAPGPGIPCPTPRLPPCRGDGVRGQQQAEERRGVARHPLPRAVPHPPPKGHRVSTLPPRPRLLSSPSIQLPPPSSSYITTSPRAVRVREYSTLRFVTVMLWIDLCLGVLLVFRSPFPIEDSMPARFVSPMPDSRGAWPWIGWDLRSLSFEPPGGDWGSLAPCWTFILTAQNLSFCKTTSGSWLLRDERVGQKKPSCHLIWYIYLAHTDLLYI